MNSPYVDEVLASLPKLSEETRLQACREIARLESRGFTREDAVSYMRCTEEINPALNEAIALNRMARISAKYNPK